MPDRPGAGEGTPLRKWLIVALTLIAEIMNLLDTTIINVAGPALERSLGATPAELQWTVGGYTLTLGAGLIVGGRLGDRYGRRRMFLVALGGFITTSVLCAAAPAIEVLIASRLAQGFAAALLLPQGFGLLRENLDERLMIRAFSLFGTVLGLAGVAGPVVGGALIGADIAGLGWRAGFLVNLPVGLLAMIVAARVLPARHGTRTVRIDAVGAALLAVASILLALPLHQGQLAGWPAWTWTCLASSMVAFIVLGRQQHRVVARGQSPLVTTTLLGKRAFTVGLVATALFFGALIGVQWVLTLFLQLGHGYSAGDAGLGNVPLAAGSAIGGAVCGFVLARRLGRAVLQAGAAVQLLSTVLLWWQLDGSHPFSLWRIVPAITVLGCGAGIMMATVINVVLAAVDDDEIGSGTGLLGTAQSIGSSLGVAVLGSIFFSESARSDATQGLRAVLVGLSVVTVVIASLAQLLPVRARGQAPAPGPVQRRPGTGTDLKELRRR